ncbi:MAG TPA: tetratricopeptide repeat protein [Acidobacteriota bacterium]|nr:tetratricopeptide repeat protein [Acidobacteriota bacterium]
MKIAISVLLAVAVLVVFWRVGGFDFIKYDDGAYVFDNPIVLKGWSLEGLKWAFTTNLQAHWHPLTWLSLMTDSQLFGTDPGAYHLVSLGFHVLSVLLLFYVLTEMTGAMYCSAFVAALFGLHPLHVEPVAWIADRKDVLNTFFWITTLWLYLRYVRKPRVGRFVLALVSFLCSLMTKSMSVTLPLMLLVLDYWPLRRIAFQKQETAMAPSQPPAKSAPKSGKGSRKKSEKTRQAYAPSSLAISHRTTCGRLLLEKALFFLPMILSAILTLAVVQELDPSSSTLTNTVPSLSTLARSILGYAHYLLQAAWPAKLAIPYTALEGFPVGKTLFSLCVLLAISFLACRRWRKSPYLLAGWLWYLITLLPVIGLIKGGPGIQADRYTYVSLVGIFIMIAWGSAELMAKVRYREWILGAAATVCILCCMTVSWAQVGYWKNTVTLFHHTLAVTANNDVALNNLGFSFLEAGKVDEAMPYLLNAVRIKPEDSYIHVNLGNAYKEKGDLEKAASHYEKALSINPKYASASYNLANIYLQLNELDLCEKYFLKTIENDAQNFMAHTNLGAAYSRMGKSTEAIAQFRESIRIQPNQHLAYYGLGLEYMNLNNLEEAEYAFNKVLAFKPDYERAYCDLGTIMMLRKNYEGAIRYYAKALEINPGYEKARQLLAQAESSK